MSSLESSIDEGSNIVFSWAGSVEMPWVFFGAGKNLRSIATVLRSQFGNRGGLPALVLNHYYQVWRINCDSYFVRPKGSIFELGWLGWLGYRRSAPSLFKGSVLYHTYLRIATSPPNLWRIIRSPLRLGESADHLLSIHSTKRVSHE